MAWIVGKILSNKQRETGPVTLKKGGIYIKSVWTLNDMPKK